MHLFSLTLWMETVLYSQMFYAIFRFCSQVKFTSLNGNIAIDLKKKIKKNKVTLLARKVLFLF